MLEALGHQVTKQDGGGDNYPRPGRLDMLKLFDPANDAPILESLDVTRAYSSPAVAKLHPSADR